MAQNIYENTESLRHEERRTSKEQTLSPPSKRITSLITLLAVLALLLALLLTAVTVLFLQKERKLQELEGLAEKYNISLHLCNVSHVTLEKSNSFQLLQNISVGASEILACLERAIASQTSLQERYRDLLGLVSVSWKFYNGSFYFFSQEKKPWQEAEQACLSHGAHLTSVTSVKEMAFLHLQAKRDFFWIGLTDQREEGNWTWTDGTKYNHEVSFWREGEPNNLDSAPEKREDCVHFISDRSLPLWNDMRCGAEFRWICKKVFS